MADFESERRTILEAVAAGTLSPAEAAEKLSALEDAEGATGSGSGTGTGTGTTPTTSGPAAVRRVRIVSSGHPVRVTADSSVAEPAVEGPHTVRREGDTLVIEAEVEEANGFFLASVPPWHHRADAVHERMWRWAPPLVVRMPPDLALHVDTTATSLVVKDVKGPIAMTVAAGSANVGGFAGPIDFDVSAGSVTARGRLDGGQSSVRCSAGSVKLHLDRGSSVRVKGIANAGRLGLPRTPAHSRAGAGPRGPRGPFRHFETFLNEQETVVGEGAGLLDIEVTTGSVVVRADT